MPFKNDPTYQLCSLVSTIVRSDRAKVWAEDDETVWVQIGQLFLHFCPKFSGMVTPSKENAGLAVFLNGKGISEGGTWLHSMEYGSAIKKLFEDITGGRLHRPHYPTVSQATEKRILGLFDI